MITPETAALDRLLDLFSRSLTPELARQLVELRADAEIQAHIDALADKCTEGELTAEERAEYEGYVRAINLIAILQSKARKCLRSLSTS